MADRRVGLWLIGALGGVGSTVALGLAALRRGLADSTGLVTALPQFESAGLDAPAAFVLGGHEIRWGNFLASARALSRGSAVFDPTIVEACASDLDEWSVNLRPGVALNSGETIAAMGDRLADLPRTDPAAAVGQIQNDLQAFRNANRLDQIVVVNVASTEPPFDASQANLNADSLDDWPASALYALAAIESGFAYVNFTPSVGASIPALIARAGRRGAAVAGRDGKTGETLLKTVLAPMFARRNLRILSWVGHNILGNRDGQVLSDPRNKAAKIASKDQVIGSLLGYSPQTLTSIEHVPSLDDWKTAWDHVHFQGFLGVKMTLQFTWQGCDSVLAAPLVIDLARLALLSQRRGESGVLNHLACFFKCPMGGGEHDFHRQFEMLETYLQGIGG